MSGKGPRIGQRVERAAEAQVAVIEGVMQGGQEETAKEAREHADWQKGARSAGDPDRFFVPAQAPRHRLSRIFAFRHPIYWISDVATDALARF